MCTRSSPGGTHAGIELHGFVDAARPFAEPHDRKGRRLQGRARSPARTGRRRGLGQRLGHGHGQRADRRLRDGGDEDRDPPRSTRVRNARRVDRSAPATVIVLRRMRSASGRSAASRSIRRPGCAVPRHHGTGLPVARHERGATRIRAGVHRAVRRLGLERDQPIVLVVRDERNGKASPRTDAPFSSCVATTGATSPCERGRGARSGCAAAARSARSRSGPAITSRTSERT